MKYNYIFKNQNTLEKNMLFNLLQITLICGQMEDRWSLICFGNQCAVNDFWLKYTKEIWLHRYTVEKGRDILIAFSDNCAYYSSIPHQNTSGSFVKFHLVAKWNQKPHQLTYSATLESIGLSYTWIAFIQAWLYPCRYPESLLDPWKRSLDHPWRIIAINQAMADTWMREAVWEEVKEKVEMCCDKADMPSNNWKG